MIDLTNLTKQLVMLCIESKKLRNMYIFWLLLIEKQIGSRNILLRLGSFLTQNDRANKLTWEQSTTPVANGGKQISNASKGL